MGRPPLGKHARAKKDGAHTIKLTARERAMAAGVRELEVELERTKLKLKTTAARRAKRAASKRRPGQATC